MEEGRQAASPAGHWQGQVAWETVALGRGRALAAAPAKSLTGSLPQEGSSLLPTLLGNHSREASLPQTPKSPVPALCVCAHVRVCETLGAAECFGALCVPDWSVAPTGHSGLVWGLQQCAQGACMGVCL